MANEEVNKILEQYQNNPADIIAILQDVQRRYRYLPEDALFHISEKLDVPLSRIYHLATFFRAFSLERRGEHMINVCMGTACHVRGSPRILDALERSLNLKAGSTAPDYSCTLDTVNCVGACALGPVIVMDDKSWGKMSPQKAERMLQQEGLGAKGGDGRTAGAEPAPKAGSPGEKATGKVSAAAGKATAEGEKKPADRRAAPGNGNGKRPVRLGSQETVLPAGKKVAAAVPEKARQATGKGREAVPKKNVPLPKAPGNKAKVAKAAKAAGKTIKVRAATRSAAAKKGAHQALKVVKTRVRDKSARTKTVLRSVAKKASGAKQSARGGGGKKPGRSGKIKK